MNAEKIGRLRAGEVPIYEPGLDALMAKNVAAGRLEFSTDLASAVSTADAVFIAVGTPTRRGDGHADLTYVMAAAEEIGRALSGYTVVVTKSTVPLGTNRKVAEVNLLEAALEVRPTHLLLASTSSVYGANIEMPYNELQSKRCSDPTFLLNP